MKVDSTVQVEGVDLHQVWDEFISIHMRECGHVGTDMGKVLDVV